MIKVFYDGKCGLCAKEIEYYKKIAPTARFEWIDVTENPQALNPYKIPIDKALKRLHTVDMNHKIHIGLNSFIVIWKQLPRFKILGFLASLPLIHIILNYAYNRFADWRFARLDHCKLASKD